LSLGKDGLQDYRRMIMAEMQHNEKSIVSSNMGHVSQVETCWVGMLWIVCTPSPETPLDPFLILQHVRLVLSIEKVQDSQAELENLTSCPLLAT
jgi:hypothetical protein